MPFSNDDVIDKIKSVMESNDWSAYRLSREADIPQSTINNMFQRNTQPSLHNLRKICTALGISCDYLLDTGDKTHLLNQDELNLLEHYRRMPENKKTLIRTYMAGLTGQLPEDN